jgi:transposase InsO family protein
LRFSGRSGTLEEKRRFRVTTDSTHGYAGAPNTLSRAFTVSAPNRVWMDDVTYLPTTEGWGYLAVLLDAFANIRGTALR